MWSVPKLSRAYCEVSGRGSGRLEFRMTMGGSCQCAADLGLRQGSLQYSLGCECPSTASVR